MKEGMYLRHSGLDGEYPIIQKILKLITPGRCGGEYKIYTDKCGDWFIDSDYVVMRKSKYSFDIVDLIEVGDIIITNSGEIIRITSSNIDELKDFWKINNNHIKTILTKESIEEIGYEIGE